MKLLQTILALLMLVSCSSDNEEPNHSLKQIDSATSEAGHKAYIIESTIGGLSNTQVMVRYSGGKCGSGAASGRNTGLKLKIRWLSPDTLLISKPVEVELARNASGEYLKCGKQNIHVVIQNYN